jgi:heme/copper-type cytochrome/quinol oxidase subunit 2
MIIVTIMVLVATSVSVAVAVAFIVVMIVVRHKQRRADAKSYNKREYRQEALLHIFLHNPISLNTVRTILGGKRLRWQDHEGTAPKEDYRGKRVTATI